MVDDDDDDDDYYYYYYYHYYSADLPELDDELNCNLRELLKLKLTSTETFI